MSSYTAPTLTTTIDSELYQTQIDQNFTAIQTALVDIQNELPQNSGASASNYSWIERAIRGNGIGGVESFVPIFDTDFENVTFSAASAQDSMSWAVISQNFHYTTSSPAVSLTPFASAGDGSYPLRAGLKSLGPPSLEVSVEADETDTLLDLEVWNFTLHRSGSTYTVTDLRLVADVIMDRDSWLKAFRRTEAMPIQRVGALPTSTGLIHPGIIAPFNLQILGAKLWLGTAPTGSTVTVEINRSGNLTDGNICAAAATWATSATGIQDLAAQSPAIIVAENEYIQPNLTAVDSAGDAGDLSIVIEFRRIYHELL